MKRVYPVIFIKSADGGYMAHVPDFEIDTQGNSLVDAIAMARDSIGLWVLTWKMTANISPSHHDLRILLIMQMK